MTWSSRTKRDRLDLDEARQDLRHLDPGEAALAGLRVAQPDRDRQAQRRDVRERVARIDRERRQDREDLVEEALAERLVVLRDRRVVDELDALGGERPADRDEDRRVVGDELEDALAGGGELLVGGPAVGRAGDLAGLDLLAQAGDPDLEELVEVAGEDGQELDPLEQRVALVARLVEDAGVELEPRQLAVEVREGRLRARARGAGVARPRDGRVRRDRSRPSRGRGASTVGVDGRTRAPRPARIARRSRLSPPATVPPLARRRVEPDAHPPRRTSGRRRPRRCAGSAARGACPAARRRPGPVGLATAIRRRPTGSGPARCSAPTMSADPDARAASSPAMNAAPPPSAISRQPGRRSIVSPMARTTSRAAPRLAAHSTGRRRARGRRASGRDDDGRPVGDDLAHRARQLGAVEAHREDRVGARAASRSGRAGRAPGGGCPRAGSCTRGSRRRRASAGRPSGCRRARGCGRRARRPCPCSRRSRWPARNGVVTTIMRAPHGDR